MNIASEEISLVHAESDHVQQMSGLLRRTRHEQYTHHAYDVIEGFHDEAGGYAKFMESFLERRAVFARVANIGASFVGFIVAKEHLRTPNWLTISYLYLEPEYRGAGIGKLLIDDFMEFASDRPESDVDLLVFEGNTGGQSFYLREGFEKTDIRETFFGNSIVMAKHLD